MLGHLVIYLFHNIYQVHTIPETLQGTGPMKTPQECITIFMGPRYISLGALPPLKNINIIILHWYKNKHDSDWISSTLIISSEFKKKNKMIAVLAPKSVMDPGHIVYCV